jgi:hypothetical protein
MINCEDPWLSAEEIVARAVRADELADMDVLLAILGKDAPSFLLHRPSKDWSQIDPR